MKTLLIIPAYNEADNIERVVDNIKQCYPQYDYVIVNDGSKDNTAEICRKNGYSLLSLPVNLGLSGAFQTGMRYAYENNYDYVVQVDGDGQHNPEYIASMIEKMGQESSDIVIGSRFCNKKKPNSLRMIGSRFISFAIFLTTGQKLTDPTSGMRLYNRDMISLFTSNLNCDPEPDTISFLIKSKYKITETQVEMSERINGSSYLNLSRSIMYMLHMTISILVVQPFRVTR